MGKEDTFFQNMDGIEAKTLPRKNSNLGVCTNTQADQIRPDQTSPHQSDCLETL